MHAILRSGNYSDLVSFLSGKEAVAEITANRSESMGCWEVTKILLKAPFNCILWIFWKVMSDLSFCFSAKYAHWFRHKAIWQVRDLTYLKNQCWYGERFLAGSVNMHVLERIEDYWCPSLKREEVSCEIQDLVFPSDGSDSLAISKKKRLKFYHRHGLCGGMTNWFLYLFHKSRDQFDSDKECAIAVGRQFSQGAPTEAALIQKLNTMPVMQSTAHSKASGNPFDSRLPFVEVLRRLEPARYYVWLHHRRHAVVYIKSDQGDEGIFFEPGQGTFAATTEMVAELICGKKLPFGREQEHFSCSFFKTELPTEN
jgi:hypothetical protein